MAIIPSAGGGSFGGAPVAVQPGQSVSGQAINPGLMNVYQDLLNRNQQNYDNVLSSFAQGQQVLAPQLAAINDIYGKMGTDYAALSKRAYEQGSQDIRRQAATNQGRIQQQLINSGLGGSTVLANLSLGAERQAAQEYSRLALGTAQAEADNRFRLGQAQAGSWLQGLGMRANLYGQQGGALANYRFANTAGDLTTPYASSMAGGGGGGVAARGGGGGGYRGSYGAAGGAGDQPSSFLADARARANSYFYNTPGLGNANGYAYFYGNGGMAPVGGSFGGYGDGYGTELNPLVGGPDIGFFDYE
jgi:hypothetical protein